MAFDRFGNEHAPGFAYARGGLLPDTASDLEKLKTAWAHVRKRHQASGLDDLHLMGGLERGFHIDPEDLEILEDELAPALYHDELVQLGLEHLGGNAEAHDVMLLNRQTAALLVAADVMIDEGDTVIGVSPRYSHPCVHRAVAHARGRLVDTTGVEEFRAALEQESNVSTVFLTRLSVSYEILSEQDLQEIVRLSKAAGARIIVDDAGGARVGPAVFGQSKPIALGADVAATGLDKYGTVGPRLGLLCGTKEVVGKIRARAFEMGIEARPFLMPAVVKSLRQYRPERVRELVASTKTVAEVLQQRLGPERLFETPVTVQFRAEDILEIAMERAGIADPPILPYEATAGFAMLLLRDHGILTVHFAALPPGTSALMLKFIPPETLARFGGAERLAEAIDGSLSQLAETLKSPEGLKALLFASQPAPSS